MLIKEYGETLTFIFYKPLQNAGDDDATTISRTVRTKAKTKTTTKNATKTIFTTGTTRTTTPTMITEITQTKIATTTDPHIFLKRRVQEATNI